MWIVKLIIYLTQNLKNKTFFYRIILANKPSLLLKLLAHLYVRYRWTELAEFFFYDFPGVT